MTEWFSWVLIFAFIVLLLVYVLIAEEDWFTILEAENKE